MALNNKQRKTLEAVFERPTRANIAWGEIEKLFIALGAEAVEGKGSRLRLVLAGEVAYFHRPHPGKEAKRYQVEDARRFLEMLDITP